MVEKEIPEVVLNPDNGLCHINFIKSQDQLINHLIVYEALIESNGLEFQLDFSLEDFVDQWQPWAISYSISGCKLVLDVEWTEGQGGVLMLWDLSQNRISQLTSSSFPICSFYDQPTNAIVSFHYIQQWGVRANHYLTVTPVTGIIDANALLAIDLPCDFINDGIVSINSTITILCTRGFTNNEYGSIGIFFDQQSELFYAHDMGNLYTFTRENILNVLPY
ncbi:hypothetical protein G3480_24930 [Thiorhodococcus mannitoliphagus]|uniref:Uncharacterized protein n=1 Tax=Thiorhodococcus mannitoliphagus TaxID=329406 RepID=A0A6P1E0Q5_9GAMM|nr:hypothetical protein [Thiorhodococcus mannitoliphagus]NEX23489.1 hypothetical protein [Thiorhodococcus mannitoliphagus]